jgi:PAS domain S-box-containing protein
MLLARLTRPLVAAAWVAVALACGAAGWTGYRNAQARLTTDLTETAARSAAAFDPTQVHSLAGTREDLAQPVHATIKLRLSRLLAAMPQMRAISLCRFTAESGPGLYLARAAQADLGSEIRPGDPYLAAAISPALAQVIRNGLPAADPRTDGGEHTWVTVYALVAEASATSGTPAQKEILGLEFSADTWRRELWSAALVRAYVTFVLLGLPLAGLLVLRREHEQREAIRNLSAAMEQSHSALMIVDLESRIEYANNGLCQQIGYSRRELIGRNWRDFRVAETPEEVLAGLVATVRSGRSWEGEWVNRRKNGSVYPVRGVVTPVKKRDGSLACFIAVIDDVTEAKRRETELREARDLAQAGDRAKGQFLATMSHEIRTPLNGIVGFTNLLLGTTLSTEQRDFVETIHASTESLIQLTSDILDYARIESGKLNLEPLPCDPRECVEDTLDLFAARAAEKHVVLLHHVAESVPATVLVDGGRLRQVLTNLVNNAVKFTQTGEIEVSVAAAGDAAEPKPDGAAQSSVSRSPSSDSCLLIFSVRDTGIGIPPEQHAQLFRPFKQLDSSSTRKFGGAGLGLAICKNLVELLGGQISFTSEPGRGSTFTFTITVPVASPPAPLPDLNGLRLALVASPGVLRRDLAQLVTRWRATVLEVDEPGALKGTAWETALVDLDEATARALVAPGAAPTGLPARRATALVPLTLPTELRSALRQHFHLLINKPVHHAALQSWLTGVRPAAPLSAPPPTHFRLSVLVVEDNAVNQRLMQKVLVNLGCTCAVAENGQHALAQLTAPGAAHDVVLLDLHMPELDGLATLKKIRAGEAGLRVQTIWVAALTADVRPEQRARVLAAGADDFLTKPLQLPELEASFRRYRETRGIKG